MQRGRFFTRSIVMSSPCRGRGSCCLDETCDADASSCTSCKQYQRKACVRQYDDTCPCLSQAIYLCHQQTKADTLGRTTFQTMSSFSLDFPLVPVVHPQT